MLLIGDNAQLPPVKQENSPALDKEVLAFLFFAGHRRYPYGIRATGEESGILHNATLLRNALRFEDTGDYPKLHINGFADVKRITGTELIDEIGDAYRRDGMEGPSSFHVPING